MRRLIVILFVLGSCLSQLSLERLWERGEDIPFNSLYPLTHRQSPEMKARNVIPVNSSSRLYYIHNVVLRFNSSSGPHHPNSVNVQRDVILLVPEQRFHLVRLNNDQVLNGQQYSLSIDFELQWKLNYSLHTILLTESRSDLSGWIVLGIVCVVPVGTSLLLIWLMIKIANIKAQQPVELHLEVRKGSEEVISNLTTF